MNKNKNKEEVTYYDDGSTIVDMSCVEESRKKGFNNNQNSNIKTTTNNIKSTPKEKLDTFFTAFKMMLVPTFVVIFILAILFFLFYLITR